jgi:hypothetical protein
MQHVRAHKTVAVIVALLSTAITLSSCRRVATEPETAPVKTTRASELDFRSLVYSTTFARRFGLPARGVESLDSGLQAVALRISDSPETGALCAVDLYLDDSVDFDFPTGSERRADDTRARRRPNALGLFYQVASDAASRAELTDWWQQPRGLFRTRDARGALGEFQSLALESYYRSPVRDLSIVTFEVICTVLLADGGSVEAWLLRAGQKSEDLNPASVTDSIARRLMLPGRLLKYAKTAIIAASTIQADPARLPVESGLRGPAYSLPD